MNIIYFVSCLLLFVCFVVNKETAKYLLSGYNRLSEIERNNFNLNGYLKFLKTFLIILSVSYLLFGLMIQYSFERDVLIIYSVLYPLVGLLLMLILASSFQKKKKEKNLLLTVGPLLVITIIIAIFIGMKTSKVTIEKDYIDISGPYGEQLFYKDMLEVKVVASPQQTRKISGFQLDNYRKGEFQLSNGDRVKIISGKDSCLMIVTARKKYMLDFNSDLLERLNSELINIHRSSSIQ